MVNSFTASYDVTEVEIQEESLSDNADFLIMNIIVKDKNGSRMTVRLYPNRQRIKIKDGRINEDV